MSTSFRIVFMGTPEFAVASLKALVDANFDVVAVVTVPDKPAGRGQKLQESDVKRFAKELGLPILQPEKLKDPDFVSQLRSFQADLNVVVAFRMLPEIVWRMPRCGTINLHGSLLPQYRGAAPINWAVINGDSSTGVTTFLIEKEIDTGKIIHSEEVVIAENDNAGTLHDKLMVTGANLLVKTVGAIEINHYPQVDQQLTLPANKALSGAPKIFKETCRIVWNADIAKIYNFIRGLSPYPAAWTTFVNQQTNETISAKIFEAEKELCSHQKETGFIDTDGKRYMNVAVPGGFLKIRNLQLEGKKRLGIEEFLRGFKNCEAYKMV
jgi:methionyl-tRNA formyltransferase